MGSATAERLHHNLLGILCWVLNHSVRCALLKHRDLCCDLGGNESFSANETARRIGRVPVAGA